VLLGEILLRSGMAERMYNALVLWIPWLPGGLMHSNIAVCRHVRFKQAAALGVVAALGVAAVRRRLTLTVLLNAFEGTMRATAMIMAILLAAYSSISSSPRLG
jgi:TRAP-type mannitol/chloroaromatic compound transport system permease large subunit